MYPPLHWRKSSRSNPTNCVEMAWDWRKSSLSNPTDCVELACPPHAFALRDSKNPAPTLHFPRPHLATFLTTIKADSIESLGP
jgi:uncharacterized protein DUF397